MVPSEIIQYGKIAIRNLKTRSLRSWLTIFGILIGVFLIISLLSLSEGLKETISKQLRSLGSEMIFIMPGDISNPLTMFMGGAKLEKEDLEVIKKTEGVERVLTMSYQSIVARYDEEGKTVFLAGLPLEEGRDLLEKYQGWSLADGRWPSSARKEIIIGQQLVKDFFKKELKVDSEIVLKGTKFKIVGILNSLGSKTDDSFVYMDMNLYQDITGDKRGTAQTAIVKVEDLSNVDKTAERIKENLQKIRKRVAGGDSVDFSVITSERMSGIAGSIMAIIQLMVMIFASIAILVGGIGIMNTMFTSVRERTREIGIMKAVGAKNSSILMIFLIESGIIGLAGGLGGTILGIVLAKLIESYGQVHPIFYFKASLSIGLILFGFIFSFLIGCLSGYFPAKRAANLKPVEALRRYE